jgi:hypothetical protein
MNPRFPKLNEYIRNIFCPSKKLKHLKCWFCCIENFTLLSVVHDRLQLKFSNVEPTGLEEVGVVLKTIPCLEKAVDGTCI